MTESEFKELLGGRIIYSTMFKDCKTLKHDFIVYTIMNKYRAKGKGNWFSADKVKKQLSKQKITTRFSVYNNSIINRFYKIRKAVIESRQEFNLMN